MAMFEELNNDLKVIKAYFMDKNINTSIDAYYQNDDSLDSIKCSSNIACVVDSNISSKKYENLICNTPLEKIEDKSADCIILRKASYKIGNPKEFIKICSTKLKDNGFFVLCATITDVEDAFLNTLEFKKNNNHIRFYTVKEILDFSSDIFKLEFYKEVEKVISINTWLADSSIDLEEARKDFEKFPENIKKSLKFTYGISGDLLGFSLKTGLFIFKLLP